MPSFAMMMYRFAQLFTGMVALLWLIQLLFDYSKKTRQMLAVLTMAVAVIAVVLIAARVIR